VEPGCPNTPESNSTAYNCPFVVGMVCESASPVEFAAALNPAECDGLVAPSAT